MRTPVLFLLAFLGNLTEAQPQAPTPIPLDLRIEAPREWAGFVAAADCSASRTRCKLIALAAAETICLGRAEASTLKQYAELAAAESPRVKLMALAAASPRLPVDRLSEVVQVAGSGSPFEYEFSLACWSFQMSDAVLKSGTKLEKFVLRHMSRSANKWAKQNSSICGPVQVVEARRVGTMAFARATQSDGTALFLFREEDGEWMYDRCLIYEVSID